ncbi:MAG TPA: bifunctional riboflavin kinase/FAD synthetase [Ignavibacteria bacterium]
MKVIRDFESVEYNKNSVITIGTFDGIHLGHRKIIDSVHEIRDSKNLRSIIVTFEPHPQIVLKNKAHDIKLLSTLEEKLEMFERLGIDMVYVINFTKEFSQNTAEEFYKKFIFDKFGLSDIVIGYDHMVGRNREGGFETLKKLSGEYDFNIHKIDELKINGYTVSSTVIRNMLLASSVKDAAMLLCDYYPFTGEVIYGDKLGRKIGFPTANIKPLSEYKLIPKNGVYLVLSEIKGKKYYGMMNIGVRPTVTEGLNKTNEIYFIDFNDDIYGEILKIKFLDFIREEKKFNSVNELKQQIEKDKEVSIDIINNL